MNNPNRNTYLWIFAIVIGVVLYSVYQSGNKSVHGKQISYSKLVQSVEHDQVTHAEVHDDVVTGTLTSGEHFTVDVPNPQRIMDKMAEKNIDVRYVKPSETSSFITGILSFLLPIALLFGVWMYFLRQMQSGNNRAMGFGKSRAKLLTEQQGKVTFADVAGVDEAKAEVEEIVDFLKDPRKFQKLGGKIPKGVLLAGSPGTGKTLLARAIAGEAGVPFFSISGSDFVEMFVGVGASRVRDLFEQGKKNAPCIIFIDEIDAVGRHRGAGLGGGNDEREQTLNQLLVEMDGFETNEGVILIAATNRPDVLDPALLRPGRFDRQVVVPLPDINGREAIINVHMAKVPVAQDVNPKTIARGTPGFSGADLMNLVNEAALIAARQNKRVVTSEDFEEAKDKIMMGPERRTMVMSDDEKKLTAFHEGGHALLGLVTDGSDPVHKATIIPRGRALGMVMRLPERDKVSMSLKQLRADLIVAMGGRVAEEIIFGTENVTTGAQSDIQHATRLAKSMVTKWGLSEKMGPVAYADNEEEVFLGHSVAKQQNMSDKTAQDIDHETRRILDEAYLHAKKTLKDNIDKLHLIAENLLEYETLTGAELQGLLDGQSVDRSKKIDSTLKPRSSTPLGRSSNSTAASKKSPETKTSQEKDAGKKTTPPPKKPVEKKGATSAADQPSSAKSPARKSSSDKPASSRKSSKDNE